jgi:peptidyl-prolyl cis-trans isomerase A (cyclophilin A)
VIQMGGFEYAPSTSNVPLSAIATGATVINEPVLSSVRGTLGMAKLGGDPNSATSQFFVNLSNNASILDTQNGGFTVFGQVIGDGMDIVDQIAGFPTYNFGGSFATLPLRNYTSADASNNVLPTDNSLIIISDIVVIDAAVSTNPTLNPTTNTLINASQSGSSSTSGGGSLSIMLIVGLGLISLRRRIHSM